MNKEDFLSADDMKILFKDISYVKFPQILRKNFFIIVDIIKFFI